MTYDRFSLSAPDVPATLALAASVARGCAIGDCILLRGDLGSGKTTFARGFIQQLHPHEKRILSPTFTLVQTYSAEGSLPIWHFDLYRLNNEHEIAELGLEDALRHGIALIEWPQLAERHLSAAPLDVTLSISNGQGHRQVAFNLPPAWRGRLDAVREQAA